MNLIVGGTGALGSAIVRRLRSAGAPVRVMTRRPESAAELAERGVEVVQGDLLDRDSLERACRGATAVVAAAHSLFGRGREASEHVDGRGTRDLIDAATAAGVRKFIYVSMHDVAPAYADVPFLRIKYDTERYLQDSGLAWTIVRPTAFIEQHAHMLIGEPVLRTGKTTIFGRGRVPRNFVAADDVARVIVESLGNPALTGRTVAVGGPENLSALDVVRIYERRAGRPARVRHMPLALLRVLSVVLRPVHPGISQVLQLGVLADTTDQSFDATPLRDEFGFEPMRLEEWIDVQEREAVAG